MPTRAMTDADRQAVARLYDERSPGLPPLDPAAIRLGDAPRAGSYVWVDGDRVSVAAFVGRFHASADVPALADTCRVEVYAAAADDIGWLLLHEELLRRLRADGVRQVVSVVRQDHAVVAGRLTALGYAERWRSWSARLDLSRTSPPARGPDAGGALAATGDAGETVVAELGAADAVAAHRLHATCVPDFPVTPATLPEEFTEAGFRALLDRCRAFAARGPDGALRAVTVLSVDGDGADTEFTVTDPSWRRRGLATAVKQAAITALAAEGVRLFTTGGAGGDQENTAMLRANIGLGYVLDPPWLTYGYDL